MKQGFNMESQGSFTANVSLLKTNKVCELNTFESFKLMDTITY